MIKYYIWDGSKEELQEHNSLLNFVFKNRDRAPEYLYWKHLENPLGKSIITYAKHDGKIIGARAFQPTLYRDKYFMQPCDTVTHPDFQRMGVFSLLTKLALDQIGSNVAVMNFPNNLSLPACLNAGWEFHRRKKPNIGLNPYDSTVFNRELKIPEVKLQLSKLKNKVWKEYCEWRFISKPAAEYRYFFINKNLVIVNEYRMSYCIKISNDSCSAQIKKTIPFLCYSYNSEQKFNFIERLIHRLTKRGTHMVLLRSQDLKNISGRESIELSGLMDTF